MAISRQRLAGQPAPPTADGIMEVTRDLRYLQLDPIQVVARSHELVLWSRLGTYDVADLARLRWEDRALFEYYGHQASIVLTEDYPIHNLLMRMYLNPRVPPPPREGEWRRRMRQWHQENQGLRRYVLRELRRRGPLRLRDFEDRAVTAWFSSGWTVGRNVERMLDVLCVQGKVVVAGRVGGQKLFELAARWFPEWTPRGRLPERAVESQAAQLSLRGLGVGTARHIAWSFPGRRYHHLPAVIQTLRRKGTIEEVRVARDGVDLPGPWYVHQADLPLVEALEAGQWEGRTTLLSPFDNLIIERDRTEALFGFLFRMEIYVPKQLRQHGYYVLPVLHGDRLIGRIDPAMDRAHGVLRLHAVHAEPGAPRDRATGLAIAGAVRDLAGFLGARSIQVTGEVPSGWRTAIRSAG